MDNSSQERLLPPQIGPYRIRAILGTGGMGVVYRAHDPAADREVAVKTVSGLGVDRIQGLRGEIIALKRIRHPGLVQIIRDGVDDGIPWYAMELIPGTSLAAYNDQLWAGHGRRVADTIETLTESRGADDALAPGPALAPSPLASAMSARPPAAADRLQEVLKLYQRLCLVLEYLHAHGLVHRDVKPANVIIQPDGQPVLLDFGLTTRARGTVGREALETIGRPVGTAAYLAPEQIRREFVDARADLYSVGCMLYETLTGMPPFRGSTVQEFCRQHLETPPLRPSALVNGLPPELDELVMRLLAKTKRDRIGHADDVALSLGALGAGDADVAPDAGAATYLYRPEISGREDILREIQGALDGLTGGSGRCILVGGESGAGKTFLASGVGRVAWSRGLRVVAGECLPAGLESSGTFEIRNSPLHPLQPLFQAIADACRPGGSERTQKLLGRRGKTLEVYAPVFEDLPGQRQVPTPPDLGAEENLRRLLDDLVKTVDAFAREGRPLLLILDDLQWADEVTIKFLDSVLRESMATTPLLILGTYRSDEVEAGLGNLLKNEHVSQRTIDRLGERHVGRVIADMLGVATAPDALVRFVARHAEGNPFFIAEYLRAAVADGLLTRSKGAWTLGSSVSEDALGRIPVPRSVQDLVGRRLASLQPEARNLLENAAVLGRVVDPAVLVSVTKSNDQTVLPILTDLAARQILETTETGGFRFAHDKFWEITYRAIPAARRRDMHRAAAEAMEPVLSVAGQRLPFAALAHHFTQGEEWSKAVDYFEKAGDEALATFSNHEAISCFRSALTLSEKLSGDASPSPLRLARWERGLVDAHLGLGENLAGREHAEKALRHCGLPLPKTNLGWVLGVLSRAAFLAVQSRIPGAFRVRSEHGADLLSEGSYVLNRLFEPLLFENLPLQVVYCGLRNLSLAQRLPPTISFARGYASMSVVAGMATPLIGIARAWADKSVQLARTLAHQETLTYTLGRSAIFFIITADWEEGGRRLREGREIAARIGDRRGFEEILAIEGLRLFYAGQFEASRADAAELHESGAGRGDKQTEHWGDNMCLQALARLGRLDEANQVLERCTGFVDDAAPDLDKAYAYGNFAFLQAEMGDLVRARRYAGLSLQYLGQKRPAAYFLLNGLVGTAEAYIKLAEAAGEKWQERDDLRTGLARCCRALGQLSQLMPFGKPADHLYRGLHLFLRGRTSAGFRTLTRGLHWAQKLRMPYEEARIRTELGRRLPVPEGIPHLEEARRIFGELQAAGGLALANRLLGERSKEPS